ncbi:RDD family protein [Pengzhenrongella sp.]|jgi:uncharacterized RDD family membrane protein YckC|uniref:RDD family protein n=1 Tax=Pengzhenrongella sp. TaxID=2888820 RepID=UPI002F91FB31
MSIVTTTPDPTILGAALNGTVPAPVGRRIGASLIDTALAILVEAAAFGLAYAGNTDPYLIVAIALLVLGFVQWRLHATTGQTIGKRAVGARTLAVPGCTLPGWGRTLGRYLLLALASFIPLGGLLFVISLFWDKDRLLRGWHDKAANVFLIDIRAGRDPLAPGVGAAVTASTHSQVLAPAGPSVAPPVVARVQPVAMLPDPVAPSTVGVAPVAAPASPPALPLPVGPVPPAPPTPTVSRRHEPLSAPSSAGASTGIISAVPGLSAPTRPTAAPPPPPPSPARSDPRPSTPVGAVPFSPLPAPPKDDDAEMTVMSLDSAAPVTEVRLVFDTGDALPVTGRGRIGRDPVAGNEPVSHLVPLADSTKSVSKTHLEFVLGDGGLWVCDLHSTNGSSIERTGARTGARTALQAGEWVLAETGSVVHLGSRTFRVEVP